MTYNSKCNKYFKTDMVDKYHIYFYLKNNFNFIILRSNILNTTNEIWAHYKICCSYDVNNNYLLKGKDMIIIEKSIIDDKILFDEKKIKNIDNLEEEIQKQLNDKGYMGYVKSKKNNIIYYYLITEIIKS